MNEPSAEEPSRFEVRCLDPAEVDARWDAFVTRSDQANPFATRAWLRSAAETVGASVDHWVVLKGQEWIAGLAIPFRRAFGSVVYRGLPLAAYSSVLFRGSEGGSSSSAESERLEAGRTLARALARRYRLASLMLVPSIDDVRAWQWEGWRAIPRYTCTLDLTAPGRPADSVRRHVRKCAEAGVTFDRAWDLEKFWSILDETRERQGFKVSLSRASFFALAKSLRDAGLAWMATALSAGGEAVSSQIVLSVPGTPGAFMWVAGSRRSHLASGVSAWLMLEIAAEAGRRGHRFWDLCGADYPNIARFKRELGATLGHYFQVEAPRSALERWVMSVKRRHA
ncbi:MAG: GNAT family N-acetyltransferase [Candidatus Eisenbacteria bacterium]|nr:GNAT family N-acetyltransferase [Candidatus Eisenbacteria bacterium]